MRFPIKSESRNECKVMLTSPQTTVIRERIWLEEADNIGYSISIEAMCFSCYARCIACLLPTASGFVILGMRIMRLAVYSRHRTCISGRVVRAGRVVQIISGTRCSFHYRHEVGRARGVREGCVGRLKCGGEVGVGESVVPGGRRGGAVRGRDDLDDGQRRRDNGGGGEEARWRLACQPNDHMWLAHQDPSHAQAPMPSRDQAHRESCRRIARFGVIRAQRRDGGFGRQT